VYQVTRAGEDGRPEAVAYEAEGPGGRREGLVAAGLADRVAEAIQALACCAVRTSDESDEQVSVVTVYRAQMPTIKPRTTTTTTKTMTTTATSTATTTAARAGAAEHSSE
jgi:hypothetical protein